MKEHAVSHGFANFIVPRYRESAITPPSDDLVLTPYAGATAALRPIYEAIVDAASGFGADVAPKRTAVSLRRSKQFAVIEAPSAKRVQLGIQLKGKPTTDRLLAGNAMYAHKVNVTSVDEVEEELIGGCQRPTNGRSRIESCQPPFIAGLGDATSNQTAERVLIDPPPLK